MKHHFTPLTLFWFLTQFNKNARVSDSFIHYTSHFCACVKKGTMSTHPQKTWGV